MGMKSADAAVKHALDNLQRVALRAAFAGFLTSVVLILLQFAIGRLAPLSAQLQSSFEAVSVLLWPSAVLLLGAQTSHGGVVLFLLSACLNAGYFVFARLLLVAAGDKMRSHSRVLAPVAVTEQRAGSRVPKGIGAPRPIA